MLDIGLDVSFVVEENSDAVVLLFVPLVVGSIANYFRTNRPK